MRRCLVAAALLLLAAATGARAEAEPFLESDLIFPAQPKHCHSPSIQICPNGDFIVAWYRGSGERRADDVRLEGSRKPADADAWAPVFQMADVANFPDCNPVIFIDPNETLWVFWPLILDNHWESAILRARTSTDYMGDGPPVWEWQDDVFWPIHPRFDDDVLGAVSWKLGLVPEDAPGRARYESLIRNNVAWLDTPLNKVLGWMPRCHPRVLEGGRMVVPVYSDRWRFSIMAITDDWGETWHSSRPIVGPGTIQPSLCQREDGTLLAFMRVNSAMPVRRVHVAQSSDRGESWTLPEATEIPNPDSAVDCLVLDSGSWIMLCNDTEEGRHRLAVYRSTDEGETWPTVRYLDRTDEPGYSYHYPSVIQTDDGLIHAVYSWHTPEGKSIKHAAFNEPWITAEQ